MAGLDGRIAVSIAKNRSPAICVEAFPPRALPLRIRAEQVQAIIVAGGRTKMLQAARVRLRIASESVLWFFSLSGYVVEHHHHHTCTEVSHDAVYRLAV